MVHLDLRSWRGGGRALLPALAAYLLILGVGSGTYACVVARQVAASSCMVTRQSFMVLLTKEWRVYYVSYGTS